MALTKEVLVDEITVTGLGFVLFREATNILEDGKLLSKTYHRSSLTPSSDLSKVPTNVAAICNAAWTPEIVAAYEAQTALIG